MRGAEEEQRSSEHTALSWYKKGTTSGAGTGVLGLDEEGEASRVLLAFEKLRSR